VTGRNVDVSCRSVGLLSQCTLITITTALDDESEAGLRACGYTGISGLAE